VQKLNTEKSLIAKRPTVSKRKGRNLEARLTVHRGDTFSYVRCASAPKHKQHSVGHGERKGSEFLLDTFQFDGIGSRNTVPYN
jgi:hypothetical protein